MRLILDLHSRTNGQPSPRCFAGWQFKHNDRALRSVRFEQRTWLSVTWWHVRENGDDAPDAIDPHEIQWKAHLGHPDRMSTGCVPFQQKPIDPLERISVRQTGGPRSRCVGNLDIDHAARSPDPHRGRVALIKTHPHERDN
jgi:hypothetical protein